MAEERLISVARLRCAVVDREWRERWLRGEDPPTLSFAPPGSVPVNGTLFHKLVDQFTEYLSGTTKGAKAAAFADEHALWGILYDRLARVRLEELASKEQLPAAHRLAQALRAFCRRMVELRERAGSAFQTWQDVYLTREFRIDPVRFELGGGGLSISGRPDAVRVDPANGVEVIDYKLSRGATLKHDLVQLAIYAHLLGLVKPGLHFAGMLEYYEPELHVMPVTAKELDGMWEETVLPVMEELAARTAGPAGAPVNGAAHSAEYGPRIVQCFAAFKLPVEILGHSAAPQLLRYRVLPASGVRVVSLANRAEDLQVALGLRQAPLVQAAPGCVTIDLPKESPDPVRWRDWTRAAAEPVSFPIGLGVDGGMISAAFTDPNTCHMLVAGAAGSGKSEFLKSLVASLVAGNSPEKLRLFLIDPKAVTFGALAGSPHLGAPIVAGIEDAIERLEAAVQEMERRYTALAKAGLESVSQLGSEGAMPSWILVFDEFGDLILSGKREKEVFETLVTRIAQKGRAAGIHLVLATQRPDRKVVTGLLKSNLPLKVCLRVTSAVNSQIVLDEPGAESLLGRGDLLCDRGHGLERAQALLISAEELRELTHAPAS